MSIEPSLSIVWNGRCQFSKKLKSGGNNSASYEPPINLSCSPKYLNPLATPFVSSSLVSSKLSDDRNNSTAFYNGDEDSELSTSPYLHTSSIPVLSEGSDNEVGNNVEFNYSETPSILNVDTPNLSTNNDTSAGNSTINSLLDYVNNDNYQNIDFGNLNLNETFTKNINPNTVVGALKSLRLKNLNNVIIAHININSVSQKFEQLSFMIRDNVDILVVGETKLDETFPTSQFHIDGFSQPYRLDRNRYGGGVMIFVREDLPSKQLFKHTFPDEIEALVIEINLRKTKFLLLGGYRPPAQSQNYFFDAITNALDVYSGTYDKFLLADDFNSKITETTLEEFMYENNLNNIINDNTCFKNPDNPSCIDLFLTNFPRCFQNTTAICTGLSDFHKMIVAVQKYTFVKEKRKVIQYRCYKNFDNISFRNELRSRLSTTIGYSDFDETCRQVFDYYVPTKSKTVRANHASYMTKNLRKAIMRRSELESKYLKKKNPESVRAYKKQKNYCSRLYKKERKRYYVKLDMKNITDNKKFWRTKKPFLSDKGVNSDKIVLIENEKIICEVMRWQKHLTHFFLKLLKILVLLRTPTF